ncbi:NUDIX hydrolase [Catenulispora rubra]|uniref:NUDIX hydrolase n=1 Tax=Catenulispora rubra TaxID=280293 RepID=UPI0018921A11|nr:NUDIX hydrolase [Catenulispora rubra]
MDVVEEWSGSLACSLQAALRMTNEGFANHLGVAVRTVATWHADPDVIPRAEMQQLLDTALERSPDATRTRFALLVGAASKSTISDPAAQSLRVAIAIVMRGDEVLLVCRRGDDAGGITWQFPAGVIKPGGSPELVAVRETLAETGVHCTVRQSLGTRLHPITGVLCDYLLCDYLAGDAANNDVVENVEVLWAARSEVTRFIPAERIYRPVLKALEEST